MAIICERSITGQSGGAHATVELYTQELPQHTLESPRKLMSTQESPRKFTLNPIELEAPENDGPIIVKDSEEEEVQDLACAYLSKLKLDDLVKRYTPELNHPAAQYLETIEEIQNDCTQPHTSHVNTVQRQDERNNNSIEEEVKHPPKSSLCMFSEEDSSSAAVIQLDGKLPSIGTEG